MCNFIDKSNNIELETGIYVSDYMLFTNYLTGTTVNWFTCSI